MPNPKASAAPRTHADESVLDPDAHAGAHAAAADDIDVDVDEPLIALYYVYTPRPIPPPSLPSHVETHRTLCSDLGLNGRIRVSSEGVNGVLSGRRRALVRYERSLRRELEGLMLLVGDGGGGGDGDGDGDGDSMHANGGTDAKDRGNGGGGGAAIELDVKYCKLRPDVPAERQMFDSLSVKQTRDVVSLYEPTAPEGGGGKNKARWRTRRRRRRKQKQGQGGHEQQHEQQQEQQQEQQDDTGSHVQGAPQSQESAISVPTSPEELDLTKYPPAPHLTPEQWNEHLLGFAAAARSENSTTPNGHPDGGDGGNSQHADDDDDDGSPTKAPVSTIPNSTLHPHPPDDYIDGDGNAGAGNGGAILLDARNVYETRVGHFAVPGIPTILPNTRKYSSLPAALDDPDVARQLAGREVFMYCTGGVRCERASAYVSALGGSGRWRELGLDRPRGVYQLRGGIQRYLEVYGSDGPSSTAKVEERRCGPSGERDGEIDDDLTDGGQRKESKTPLSSLDDEDSSKQQQCLFKGKNFVFDPRRTDPVVGPDSPGRCLLCNVRHDDYDNGHAPCEDRAGRCCRCRVLVLVCDGCRCKVRSWGEDLDVEGGINDSAEKKDVASSTEEGDRTTRAKPDLFCGPEGRECVDEGNNITVQIVRG